MFPSEENFRNGETMQTKQDQIVTQSVTDPQSLPPNSIGYGVIMRYGMDVWKYPHWSAHQYAMQSNALALVLMEKKNQLNMLVEMTC